MFTGSLVVAGEAVRRTFYAHADTGFDPLAAAIAVTTLFVEALALFAVLSRAV